MGAVTPGIVARELTGITYRVQVQFVDETG